MKNINLVTKIELIDGKIKNCNQSPVDLCIYYSNNGVDGIIIEEISDLDVEHDKNIDIVKDIVSAVDIPVYMGGSVKRLEDVKKYIYTGASMAILDISKDSNMALIKEASERFGSEKIILKAYNTDKNVIEDAIQLGGSIVLTNSSENFTVPSMNIIDKCDIISIKNSLNENSVGVVFDDLSMNIDYSDVKLEMKNNGISSNVVECTIEFSALKTDDNGLIPVVVQDYQTNEVLMMAYMNEESFNATIKTGRMTYYSRSRKELWEKGLTSGHFQYLKSLEIDCDKDTLLAKVYQVGAACHTNNKTCFFTNIYKKDYKENNPHKVFEDVYNVIMDRKNNPKTGSYTNYLFDKGIDKILKKVGEEATEIVIAAKNPNPEEIKYEISDFLYHVMVLMAEKGVTWEDVTTELSRR